MLCVTVLIPVVSDSSATTTFSNLGGAYYEIDLVEEGDIYTFEWDHTEPTKAKVNGEIVDLYPGTTLFYMKDQALIRYGLDATGYYLQAVPGTTIYCFVQSAGDNEGDFVANWANNSFEAICKYSASNDRTSTLETTEMYAVSNNGDYILKKPGYSAYILDDSPIFGMGLTSLDGVWSNEFQISGTKDLMQVSSINAPTYTLGDVNVETNSINGYVGLNTFDNVSFTATNTTTGTVAPLTYNYVIVPKEVTAEKTIHADGATLSLISIIPLLVLTGLVIGVVGSFIRNRD